MRLAGRRSRQMRTRVLRLRAQAPCSRSRPGMVALPVANVDRLRAPRRLAVVALTLRGASALGAPLVVVGAIDEAGAFYRHHGFTDIASVPGRLILPSKRIPTP